MARTNPIGRPRNWEKFQHYKNRKPPWIKLHHDLIDDREYQRLPIASRALAPQLWLMASESKDGLLVCLFTLTLGPYFFKNHSAGACYSLGIW